MRLDLEELEQRPTNLIDGFGERLEKLLPSMFSHRCSKGVEGGFFSRVKEGTWMGHVIEHIALEIQTLAGMDTGFGRTRETKTPGVYNVVFSYLEEKAGAYAAEAAVNIAQALIDNVDYDLAFDIQRMKELREAERLGPSTGSIVEEAVRRNIPWIRLNKNSLVQLGYGKNQVRFRATMTEKTSSIAVDLAGDKEETKRLLTESAIPVADGVTLSNPDDLENAVNNLGFPLVFKPLDGNHGKGATINVKTMADAFAAFEYAKTYSRRVIIEKFVVGYDFRVLVIDNKMVAAAQRDPAHVNGNGIHTIQQLIDTENEDPRRGYGHENVLTEISVDRDTLDLLAKKNYTLESVPEKGEIIYLKSTANLSTGGTSLDVTDSVHPQNIFICERISRVIGLDICGIDIMAQNLTQPLKENGGVVLEVNAAPGFRMHLAPSEGLPRNVAAKVIDMLYPPSKLYKIPIIAVTGTNGKTTTTRLIAHIIRSNGKRVGYTTSDGIYVHNTMLMQGDTTGPVSASFILKDPTVEFAVLETARGGILRSGLAFDSCDIGVVTNIQEDHLGISDIHTLEDLRRVKEVVIGAVRRKGWAVLNADNGYCVKIGREARCNVAYFSMDENNPIIKEHCKKGGVAAIYENGFITVKTGDWKLRVDRATHVPLTFGGSVNFMIQNVLAATLSAYLWGYKPEDIKLALETFIPSAAHTPGRMNVFSFKDFKILVDFAHNPDGFLGVKSYLQSIEATKYIGIISGTGDRRNEDIKETARISAQMFDKIYICQEKYMRGREQQELINLLLEGIAEVDDKKEIIIINNSKECLEHAIDHAEKGSYITILSNTIDNVIQNVTEHLDQELES
ncbi:MAG: cyanophycin synthetase [Pedobacter sp.]|nr:cyanophycin synthetase [Pedobacter sp.]